VQVLSSTKELASSHHLLELNNFWLFCGHLLSFSNNSYAEKLLRCQIGNQRDFTRNVIRSEEDTVCSSQP
jgi:hypothetical protein